MPLLLQSTVGPEPTSALMPVGLGRSLVQLSQAELAYFLMLPESLAMIRDGFLAGLTLGYNANFGSSFVGGIESDIAYTDVDASQTNTVTVAGTTTSATLSRDMQWFGTVRARAGWLASREFLIYATGGLAYANVERNGSITVGGATTSGSGSDWKTGWTVGGGMEWLLGNKTTFKTEYLYYDIDDSSVTFVSAGGANSATYKSENQGSYCSDGAQRLNVLDRTRYWDSQSKTELGKLIHRPWQPSCRGC